MRVASLNSYRDPTFAVVSSSVGSTIGGVGVGVGLGAAVGAIVGVSDGVAVGVGEGEASHSLFPSTTAQPSLPIVGAMAGSGMLDPGQPVSVAASASVAAVILEWCRVMDTP